MIKINLECLFCQKEEVLEVESKHGIWGQIYHKSFCEEHKLFCDFLESNCCGCVSFWKDCDFHDVLFNLNVEKAKSLSIVKKGICPYRVNGSSLSIFKNGGPLKINLSEKFIFGEDIFKMILDYFRSIEEWYVKYLSKKKLLKADKKNATRELNIVKNIIKIVESKDQE